MVIFEDGQLVQRPSAAKKPATESVGVSSSVLLFDACHVGVVLRVVLAVELVVAVSAMFVSDGLSKWLSQVSLWTAGALPACLLWLVVACGLKRPLAGLPIWGQYVAGTLLGMLAGQLYLSQWKGPPRWVAVILVMFAMAAFVTVPITHMPRLATKTSPSGGSCLRFWLTWRPPRYQRSRVWAMS